MRSRQLIRREENRHDTSDATRCRVGVEGGESHPALESDQFAHGRHAESLGPSKGTMKRCAIQGATR